MKMMTRIAVVQLPSPPSCVHPPPIALARLLERAEPYRLPSMARSAAWAASTKFLTLNVRQQHLDGTRRLCSTASTTLVPSSARRDATVSVLTSVGTDTGAVARRHLSCVVPASFVASAASSCPRPTIRQPPSSCAHIGRSGSNVNVRHFGTWPKVRPKRIRVVTMDVTGTLVSFRGTLEDHYLGAARKCGVEITDDIDDPIDDDDNGSDSDNAIESSPSASLATPASFRFSDAFRLAYKETSLKYPCFGADEMSAKEWWRLCVLRSFELAGARMSEHQQDIVFQRIYSTFGSHAAYEVFPDALPFLRWAQRHGVVCGVLSNADERYGDSILPMLGLTPDELQFQCFSKDFGIEKPDARFFLSAMKHSRTWLPSKDELQPSEVLHIGNDFAKDFEGAKRAGMHTVLLDRYEQTDQADEWKRRGAQVFQDLVDVVEFLGRSNCQLG